MKPQRYFVESWLIIPWNHSYFVESWLIISWNQGRRRSITLNIGEGAQAFIAAETMLVAASIRAWYSGGITYACGASSAMSKRNAYIFHVRDPQKILRGMGERISRNTTLTPFLLSVNPVLWNKSRIPWNNSLHFHRMNVHPSSSIFHEITSRLCRTRFSASSSQQIHT